MTDQGEKDKDELDRLYANLLIEENKERTWDHEAWLKAHKEYHDKLKEIKEKK